MCKQSTIERASSNLALMLSRRAAVYCKSNLSSSFFRFQTESVDIHQDVLQAVNLLLIVSMAPLILILPAISFLYKQLQEPRAKNLTILVKISCSVVLATTLRYNGSNKFGIFNFLKKPSRSWISFEVADSLKQWSNVLIHRWHRTVSRFSHRVLQAFFIFTTVFLPLL